MSTLDLYNDALGILLWMSIFSILCSCATLLLMYRLEVYKNRLMLLICVMTFLQGMYDFALVPLCTDNNSDSFDHCRGAQIGIGIFTGVASAACTNVISALVCYVIYSRQRSYMSRTVMYSLILVPSLIIGIIGWVDFLDMCKDIREGSDATANHYSFVATLQVYDYWRLVQLVINLVCGAIIFYVLWSIEIVCIKRKKHASTSGNGSGESGGSKMRTSHATSGTAYPMFLLAMRLIWYPIAQSVTRFGASWFQFAHNGTITDYIAIMQTTTTPNLVTLQLYTYVFTVPSAGIAYFIIFLIMQKGARREFCMPFKYIFLLVKREENSAAITAATISSARNSSVKAMFESDMSHERSRHNSNSVNSLEGSVSTYDDPNAQWSDERDSSMYSIATDVPSRDSVEFAHNEGDDSASDSGKATSHHNGGMSITSQSSNLSLKLNLGGHETSRYNQDPHPNLMVLNAIDVDDADELTRRASQHLSSMRRRSSVKRNNEQVNNVSAIIDHAGDVEDVVVDQLDEDELFELIAEQAEQDVHRQSLRSSSAVTAAGVSIDATKSPLDFGTITEGDETANSPPTASYMAEAR